MSILYPVEQLNTIALNRVIKTFKDNDVDENIFMEQAKNCLNIQEIKNWKGQDEQMLKP